MSVACAVQILRAHLNKARRLNLGWLQGLRTNVAREHEEVIVSQTTILLGIDERLDVNAIALLVLVLEHLKRLGVVQGVGGGVDHGVAVLDGHFESRKDFPRNREVQEVTRRNRPQYVDLRLWPGKSELFPRARDLRRSKSFCEGAKDARPYLR